MIDPLRPYWPTNRSIAGLLVRSVFLVSALGAVMLLGSRFLATLFVLAAALAQGSFLIFEWMELRRTGRAGLVVGGVVAALFLALVVVLVIESRSVLVLTQR